MDVDAFFVAIRQNALNWLLKVKESIGSGELEALMKYKVIKVLNNNAILSQKMDGTQIVLMSNGIGFGKKKGDLANTNGKNQKIFYSFDNCQNIDKLKQFNYEENKIEKVTKEIVEIANEKFNIGNNNLYSVLLDHITFAIECLQIGLPINNPFASEISVLYSKEYDVAQIAADIIKERIGIDIGVAEIGFIAFHLYSAQHSKHIQITMKDTRIYCEILEKVSRFISGKLDGSSPLVEN